MIEASPSPRASGNGRRQLHELRCPHGSLVVSLPIIVRGFERDLDYPRIVADVFRGRTGCDCRTETGE